jgi:hypothetical protein
MYHSATQNTSVKSVRSQSQFNINDFYLTKLMNLRSEKQSELASPQKSYFSPNLSKPKRTTGQKISDTLSLTLTETRKDNKFFARLIGAMKEFYGSRQTFLNLFHKLDQAFEVQGKILDSIACYKPELGVLMDSSVKDLYECCIQLLSATKKEIDIAENLNEMKLRVNTQKMNEMETQRTSLQDLLSKYEHLIWAKNTEVPSFSSV